MQPRIFGVQTDQLHTACATVHQRHAPLQERPLTLSFVANGRLYFDQQLLTHVGSEDLPMLCALLALRSAFLDRYNLIIFTHHLMVSLDKFCLP